MASNTVLGLGLTALIGVGAADLAWINLSLGPRVISSTDTLEIEDGRAGSPMLAVIRPVAVTPVAEPAAVVVAVRSAPVARVAAEHVYFETMSQRIGGAGRDTLERIIANADPHAIIQLTGYADHRGSTAYNADLSKRRVAATAAYLMSRGVAAHRLARELGDRATVATPERELWRERRVDIQILAGARE
jgi:outer membrane protein OmpA-like peptidoglycan-associated protein